MKRDDLKVGKHYYYATGNDWLHAGGGRKAEVIDAEAEVAKGAASHGSDGCTARGPRSPSVPPLIDQWRNVGGS